MPTNSLEETVELKKLIEGIYAKAIAKEKLKNEMHSIIERVGILMSRFPECKVLPEFSTIETIDGKTTVLKDGKKEYGPFDNYYKAVAFALYDDSLIKNLT